MLGELLRKLINLRSFGVIRRLCLLTAIVSVPTSIFVVISCISGAPTKSMTRLRMVLLMPLTLRPSKGVKTTVSPIPWDVAAFCINGNLTAQTMAGMGSVGVVSHFFLVIVCHVAFGTETSANRASGGDCESCCLLGRAFSMCISSSVGAILRSWLSCRKCSTAWSLSYEFQKLW